MNELVEWKSGDPVREVRPVGVNLTINSVHAGLTLGERWSETGSESFIFII